MLDKNEEDSTESTVFETGAMFCLQCQDKLEELVLVLELELQGNNTITDGGSTAPLYC